MDDTTRRDEEADAIGLFVDERPATATREAGGVPRSLIAPASSSALMRADIAGTVGCEVQKNSCTVIEMPRAIARSYTLTTVSGYMDKSAKDTINA
jgi:hypothetical protein